MIGKKCVLHPVVQNFLLVGPTSSVQFCSHNGHYP